MQKRMAFVVLPAVVLALLVPLSSRKGAAEELSTPVQPAWLAKLALPQKSCTVWIGTDYFTDAAHTTRIGVCTITCQQFDIVDPTFTGGGTCSGTSSSYTLRRYYACPGICR
jgi:hypothetical protein